MSLGKRIVGNWGTTCWDAGRLDLTRAGILPDPKYMSTKPGRSMAITGAPGDVDWKSMGLQERRRPDPGSCIECGMNDILIFDKGCKISIDN